MLLSFVNSGNFIFEAIEITHAMFQRAMSNLDSFTVLRFHKLGGEIVIKRNTDHLQWRIWQTHLNARRPILLTALVVH